MKLTTLLPSISGIAGKAMEQHDAQGDEASSKFGSLLVDLARDLASDASDATGTSPTSLTAEADGPGRPKGGIDAGRGRPSRSASDPATGASANPLPPVTIASALPLGAVAPPTRAKAPASDAAPTSAVLGLALRAAVRPGAPETSPIAEVATLKPKSSADGTGSPPAERTSVRIVHDPETLGSKPSRPAPSLVADRGPGVEPPVGLIGVAQASARVSTSPAIDASARHPARDPRKADPAPSEMTVSTDPGQQADRIAIAAGIVPAIAAATETRGPATDGDDRSSGHATPIPQSPHAARAIDAAARGDTRPSAEGLTISGEMAPDNVDDAHAAASKAVAVVATHATFETHLAFGISTRSAMAALATPVADAAGPSAMRFDASLFGIVQAPSHAVAWESSASFSPNAPPRPSISGDTDRAVDPLGTGMADDASRNESLAPPASSARTIDASVSSPAAAASIETVGEKDASPSSDMEASPTAPLSRTNDLSVAPEAGPSDRSPAGDPIDTAAARGPYRGESLAPPPSSARTIDVSAGTPPKAPSVETIDGKDASGLNGRDKDAVVSPIAPHSKTSDPSAAPDAVRSDRSPAVDPALVVPATQARLLPQVTEAVAALARSAADVPDVDPSPRSIAPARTMELRLSPEGLGTLTIRMHVAGEALDVRLAASDPRTAALLDRDRGALESALQDQNYRLQSLSIVSAEAIVPGGNHVDQKAEGDQASGKPGPGAHDRPNEGSQSGGGGREPPDRGANQRPRRRQTSAQGGPRGNRGGGDLYV